MFLVFYAEITLICLNKKSTHFQHRTFVYRFFAGLLLMLQIKSSTGEKGTSKGARTQSEWRIANSDWEWGLSK